MADPSSIPITGPVEHRHASSVLVLGVLGLFCCGVCAPIAWVMGVRALDEIDNSGGYLGGRSQVRLGYLLGVVGTILMLVMCVLFFLALLRSK